MAVLVLWERNLKSIGGRLFLSKKRRANMRPRKRGTRLPLKRKIQKEV